MTIRDLNRAEAAVPHYRLLASGKVQQRFPGTDDTTDLDPQATMQVFVHEASGAEVRAVKIPRTFVVGGDRCTDGYLVVDHRGLSAISTPTFTKDYAPAWQLGAA